MRLLKNKLKHLLAILLISLSLFNNFAFTIPAFASDINVVVNNTSDVNVIGDNNSAVNLVRDNKNMGLPKHFRKSSDKISDNINYTGLSELNISGSAQFSEPGLSLIKKEINTDNKITIVDLREESHGFINDFPISWKNSSNNANKGLSRKEILNDESQKINDLKINDYITLYNNGSTLVKRAYTEYTLCTNNDLSYIRMPVTDGQLPSINILNDFISFVQNLPDNSYLHFHCKEGIGRTTTFMILYDIMKNYNDVPLNDIIVRQVKLANLKDSSLSDFTSGRRLKFFTDFYNRCKEEKL